jgi:glutathione S-transferase
VPRRLITVPFSHYCEKARWALDLAGLSYVEDRHLPMLHWAATFRAGGGRTVPVLTSDDGVFADSTEILEYVDAHASSVARLYPDRAPLRAECEALEDEFDERLGPAARRVGYYYAFADRRVILELARRAAPRWQFETMRAALPVVRSVIMRLLEIDADTAARSLDEVRATFDRIAAKLRDGRPYLVGDCFSAADLTFAALGAPMVQPAEHPFPTPAELFPDTVRRTWCELRAHPAGAFILRLYAEHRASPRTTATRGGASPDRGGVATRS